jgi:CHASE3 domain sensor protein
MLVLQLAIGIFIFKNVQNISRTEEDQNKIDTYLRTNTKYISNAESAQRGYLLTGSKSYLETFKTDQEEISKNEKYFSKLPVEFNSAEVRDLQRLSANKLSEMQLTITLYNAGSADQALSVVKEGSGKLMMDSIRNSTKGLRAQIAGVVTNKKNTERHLFILFLWLICLLIVFNLFLVWYSYKKLKSYTENLEHLVYSLEDANDRMRNYTFMSYHELKTPLRGISGFAQLLKKKVDPQLGEEEKEYIEYIRENVKQMDLTISKMRSRYLVEPADDKINAN